MATGQLIVFLISTEKDHVLSVILLHFKSPDRICVVAILYAIYAIYIYIYICVCVCVCSYFSTGTYRRELWTYCLPFILF